MLLAVASQCDAVESNWGEIERFCEPFPRTLVHGDFQGKNVRVRTDGSGMSLLPLDWETAGWGVPAPDLETVDLSSYWNAVRHTWPQLCRENLERLASYGLLFRLMVCISWESASLPFPSEDEAVDSLDFYHAKMKETLQRLGWECSHA